MIIGAAAGWLAGNIMKGEGYGTLMNIVLGLVGGLLGGAVFGMLGLAVTNRIGQLVSATAGAVLLIMLARAIRK